MAKMEFYGFYSRVRAFLSKLVKTPISAEPDEKLKEVGLNRNKLVRELFKSEVLERKSSIKDQTDSDFKEPTYVVKYKVRKKDFEKKIHRLYIKFCEKNIPNKKLNEMTELPKVFAEEDKLVDEILKMDEDNAYKTRGGLNFPMIHGQKYNEQRVSKPKRTIRITESQFEHLQNIINEVNAGDEELEECTSCGSVGGGTTRGDMGYDAPGFDTSDKKFWGDSLKR